MSLRHDASDPRLSDRDRDSAAFRSEDERYLSSGPLACDCGECPECMPEAFDASDPGHPGHPVTCLRRCCATYHTDACAAQVHAPCSCAA